MYLLFNLGDIMYEKLAIRLTDFFINKNIIKKEERDIYAYGMKY